MKSNLRCPVHSANSLWPERHYGFYDWKQEVRFAVYDVLREIKYYNTKKAETKLVQDIIREYGKDFWLIYLTLILEGSSDTAYGKKPGWYLNVFSFKDFGAPSKDLFLSEPDADIDYISARAAGYLVRLLKYDKETGYFFLVNSKKSIGGFRPFVQSERWERNMQTNLRRLVRSEVWNDDTGLSETFGNDEQEQDDYEKEQVTKALDKIMKGQRAFEVYFKRYRPEAWKSFNRLFSGFNYILSKELKRLKIAHWDTGYYYMR